MQFNSTYFLAALLLFFTEVFIAAVVQDSFIRPYGGDFLVVVFLYCLLKSFSKIPVKNAIFGVLFFAYAVEAFQYFDLPGMLGLSGNKIALVVLGNHFEWLDMLIYSLAGVFIFIIEQARGNFSKKRAEAKVEKF